jgi:DEAD/DEAH box helicase
MQFFQYTGGGGGDRLSNLGQGLSQIDFSKTELVPFEKDFYIEHPDVSARSDAQADAWRASKGIQVRNCGAGEVPKPVFTFDEASMPEYVLNEVLKCGFDKPTPIQSQGWPMALKGNNMVGVSATGSGKTLAFLLPGMIHINAQVRIMMMLESCWMSVYGVMVLTTFLRRCMRNRPAALSFEILSLFYDRHESSCV